MDHFIGFFVAKTCGGLHYIEAYEIASQLCNGRSKFLYYVFLGSIIGALLGLAGLFKDELSKALGLNKDDSEKSKTDSDTPGS